MVTLFAHTAGRFGVNPKEAERFFKFLIVGSIGFVVDFGVFNLLLGPLKEWLQPGHVLFNLAVASHLNSDYVVGGLAAVLAGTISFIAAIVSNFLWNRYWTYPDSRSKSMRRQFVQFGLVSLTGIVFRVPIIALARIPFIHFAEGMTTAVSPELALRLAENMALALSVVIVMFWNFFVNRYWTYNDVE